MLFGSVYLNSPLGPFYLFSLPEADNLLPKCTPSTFLSVVRVYHWGFLSKLFQWRNQAEDVRLHRQARLLVLVPGLALSLLQTLAPPVRVLHLDLDLAPDQFLHLLLLPAVQVLVAPAHALLLIVEGSTLSLSNI